MKALISLCTLMLVVIVSTSQQAGSSKPLAPQNKPTSYDKHKSRLHGPPASLVAELSKLDNKVDKFDEQRKELIQVTVRAKANSTRVAKSGKLSQQVKVDSFYSVKKKSWIRRVIDNTKKALKRKHK